MVDGSTQRWRAALCLRWRARWRWLTTLGLLSVSFTRLFCCCCLRGGPLFVFEDASFSQLVYREFNRKRTGWEQKEGSTMRAHSKELLAPTSANTSSESLNHLKAPCKKISLVVLKGTDGKGNGKRCIPSALRFGGNSKQAREDWCQVKQSGCWKLNFA